MLSNPNFFQKIVEKGLFTYMLYIFHCLFWVLAMEYFPVPRRTWKLEVCPASPHVFIRFCLNVCNPGVFPSSSKILWFACDRHKLEKAVLLGDCCPTDKYCKNSSLCVNSYCIYWNRLSDLSLGWRQTQKADKYVLNYQLWICLALAGLKNVIGLFCLSVWNSIRKEERFFYYVLGWFFSLMGEWVPFA